MNKQYFLSALTVIMIFVAGCSSSKTASAEPPAKWEVLGEKRVNYRMERDVMNISGRDVYKQIRIAVNGGSLNMYRATIYFENGGTQEVDLRKNFRSGSSSRVIDLTGSRRRIDKITFWYDTKNQSRRKAVLTVWGK
ncbi:DUF2541 family protein [Pseudobacter ginsenosidimutans]|uniref:Uncharacterized protein DUF2541 n=1 Tax=Pseudobacter ginsenosidimutans TaxID=661488 RepID=A0A4Q7MTA6_9BACT|nr:DUF2541 family protein [Pseudobacter ginsenosidimutans]QEC42025.1 DUF2541 family protein [Pseudobacter ginsenosidimutans]RZS71139.1 uncharacterized protein DUF2541 [Pseudobacter ginsenosidimutans]